MPASSRKLADRVAALEEKRGGAGESVTISIDGISRETAVERLVRQPGESAEAFKQRGREILNSPIWISIR